MVMEKFYQHAEAAYFCNVHEFICTGEGRELSRLQNLMIMTKYPKVEQWYRSLDEAGRGRVDRFLQ